MVLTHTPAGEVGWTAADFELEGTDDVRHRLADLAGPRGTVVMFICNHCPYVLAQLDEIVRDAGELKSIGVNSIAIMPNDTAAYPADSFDNMKKIARERNFPFPYLIDPTQQVARDYDAVCTPDFYGFDADLALQYRGRLTELRNLKTVADARRELFEAMRMIAETGQAPGEQKASMGCSIKWLAA